MRVVDIHKNAEETAANLSRLMDEFASVSMHASGAPAIGGYRVIHAPRPQPRPAPRPQRGASHKPRSRRTQLHMTGIAAMLLVSSLGVAAFSGPASCPTCRQTTTTAASEESDAPGISRLAYAQPSIAFRAYRVPLGQVDLATVKAPTVPEARTPSIFETIELADAEERETSSPISTSAIEPAAERTNQATVIADDTRGGLLPARSVELTDAAPQPIRLAAASPVEVLPENASEIDVRTLPVSSLADDDAQADPEPNSEPVTHEIRAKRDHVSAKRKTYRAYRSVRETRESKAKRLANIPSWAEKMFVPNWQSRAFSY